MEIKMFTNTKKKYLLIKIIQIIKHLVVDFKVNILQPMFKRILCKHKKLFNFNIYRAESFYISL